MTVDEVMEQFPVAREEVEAVLEFVARSLPNGPCAHFLTDSREASKRAREEETQG